MLNSVNGVHPITLVHHQDQPLRTLTASSNDANNNGGNDGSQITATNHVEVVSTNVSLRTSMLTSSANTKSEPIMHVAQSNLEDSDGKFVSRILFLMNAGCDLM